jgi:hypothetical protein
MTLNRTLGDFKQKSRVGFNNILEPTPPIKPEHRTLQMVLEEMVELLPGVIRVPVTSSGEERRRGNITVSGWLKLLE